jgi:uncharacterized protein (TIGR00251 family)
MLSNIPGGVSIAVKAVPGSSRDQIVGPLGDRLKIKVAAPPEDGKANAAICALIADAVGIAPRNVSVVSGHSRAEKTVAVSGVTPESVATALGVPVP